LTSAPLRRVVTRAYRTRFAKSTLNQLDLSTCSWGV
jgi:hypothetical protein